MAQQQNLLDLLDDDEEEEVQDEAFNEFQQLLRGGTAADNAASGSAPATRSLTPSQAGAPAQAPPNQTAPPRNAAGAAVAGGQGQAASPGQARTAQKGAFPVQILLEWCKQNMSAADMGKIHGAIRDMKTKVAQGTKSPKDVYAAILTLIGADRVNDVKAHIVREMQTRAAQGTQSSNAIPQSNGAPNARPPPAGGQAPGGPHVQQAPSNSASGGSIMQSLMYNAQQHQQPAEQPKPAASQPPTVQQPRPPQPWQPAPTQRVSQPQGAPVYQQYQPQPQPAPGVQRPSGAAPVRPPAAALAAGVAGPAKHPAESAPPSQPGPKRAKKDKDDVEDENDVLKDSGINLEEEQSALLGTLERTKAQPSAVAAPEQPFLNAAPLNVKVLDIAKKHGLESVDQQVGQLLGRAADIHLGSLIDRIYTMTRQRTDAERNRQGMVQSSNLRKRLHEYNMQRHQKQEAAQRPEDDQQAAATSGQQDGDAAKKPERTARKETEKQQATAANAAAAAAFGSKAKKWGAWSLEAAKKPLGRSGKASSAKAAGSQAPAASSPAPEGASSATGQKEKDGKQPEASRPSVLPPTRIKAEMMSAKLEDLVAVLERDPMYQRSTLLYKMYGQL